jgi:sugar/nucleoside kinase (ribokinase family)
MSSMLVVGSVAFDTLHFTHDPNNQGSHPFVLGGSAVFASLAAVHFVRPRVVGVVGTDFPDTYVSLLKDKGVDLTGLEVVEGKTFHWEGRYSADLTSRTSLRTDLNVFADFHPKIPAAFKTTPYVLLGNIHPSLQMEVLDQIERPKLVLADTMNFWIEGTPKELAAMLAKVDVLVINEEEARQLAGTHHIMTVARKLRSMGPRICVIKRGEYGALLFDGNEVFSAPAFPVEEVKDPTGAGDTFAGGMLGYIARAERTDMATLRRAVIYGSTLASFLVEDVSVARLASVTSEELERRFLGFARLAHFATEDELRRLAAE